MSTDGTSLRTAEMEPDDRVETSGREGGRVDSSATDPATIDSTITGAPVTESSEPRATAPAAPSTTPAKQGLSVRLEALKAFYGASEQVKGVDLEFRANEVTAIIGPSGCGKSTMVRCINRMHEEIPGARAEGRVLLDDFDVYDSSVDVVAVRRAIGMVFQKPNPFPTMSIFDNVASGLRLCSRGRGDLDGKVEAALARRRAVG